MIYKVFYPYIIFTIQSPISVDDFFQQFHLSKKTIHLLKQNKEYTVNNRFVASSTILVKGDQLKIKAFHEDDNVYPPCYQEIDIVYEDDFILIVNKPAFLQVYPESLDKTDSLAHRVSGYYHQKGYHIPVRFIHRLDYETSGLVLFCKCHLIQPLLDYQLSIKEIKRDYIAVVEGKINDDKIHTINKPISRDRHHNQRMITSHNGKEACTQYQCLSSSHNMSIIQCLSSSHNMSIIHCTLQSGRKHQIRVHMASDKHPLIGDKLYHKKSPYIDRQALHAYQLQFIHPITKEKMTITCHPPADMLSLIHLVDPAFE